MKERELLENLKLLKQGREGIFITYKVMKRIENEERKKVIIVSGILTPFVFFISAWLLKLIMNTPLRVVLGFIYSLYKVRVLNLSPVVYTVIFLIFISISISFFTSFLIVGGEDHEVLLSS
jgi:hypothetical protein